MSYAIWLLLGLLAGATLAGIGLLLAWLAALVFAPGDAMVKAELEATIARHERIAKLARASTRTRYKRT